jgi:hypothetical protein
VQSFASGVNTSANVHRRRGANVHRRRGARDFNAPDTDDPDPTARVQFLAVCPGGISFSWAAPVVLTIITSIENLKSVTAEGRELYGPHIASCINPLAAVKLAQTPQLRHVRLPRVFSSDIRTPVTRASVCK